MIKFWKTQKTTSKMLVVFLHFVVFAAKSQYNLVPNPSFEIYTVCPSLMYKTPPTFWLMSTNPYYSYSNSCANLCIFGVPRNNFGGHNYQYPKTGNGYLALALYYYDTKPNKRSYIAVKLTDSLILGKRYYVGYHISLTNEARIATNNAGLLFTNNVVYVDTITTPYGVLNANPQITNYANPIIRDTQNWVKVSGVYKAQGGEQYITLGNFKNDLETLKDTVLNTGSGYYWGIYNIDDVFVIPLDSIPLKAYAGKDTTITIGDSVFIGSLTNGIDSIKWQIQNTGIAIDSTRPGFWVHPLVNTCYILTQTVNGFTSSDTVCITVQPLPLKFISYTLRQAQGDNPSSLRGTKQSVENIWVTANEINVSHFNILKSVDGFNFKVIGKIVAKNKSVNEYSFIDENVNEGLNYYKIVAVDKDGKMNFSEVRTLSFKPQTLKGFNIFPNPTKSIVTIDCKDAKEISIVDYLGRVVYKEILRQAQNDNNQFSIINVQQFNRGIYHIKIVMNNGEIKTEKLVIE